MRCLLKLLLLLWPCTGGAFALPANETYKALDWIPRITSTLPVGQDAVGKQGEVVEQGRTDLSKFKDLSEAVKNLVTAGGIIVGGLWTWLLFVKKREKFPRADLTHTLTHRVLAKGQRLLHLEVKIANIGEGLLSLVSAKAWVQQILPPPQEFLNALRKSEDPIKKGQTQYAWPSLAERETDWQTNPIDIEPGENDQINYDFVVDPDAETIQIYTYFKNVQRKEREIGWHLTSVYDLRAMDQTRPPLAEAVATPMKETAK